MRIQENKINTRLLILLPDPSQKYLASSRTGCLTASSLSLSSPSSPDAGRAPALAARGAAASLVRPAGGRPRSRSGAGRPRRWPRRRIPVRCLLLAPPPTGKKPYLALRRWLRSSRQQAAAATCGGWPFGMPLFQGFLWYFFLKFWVNRCIVYGGQSIPLAGDVSKRLMFNL